MGLKCVIVRHKKNCDGNKEWKEPESAGNGLPYDKIAKGLMTASGFVKYVKTYGYHFTDELADYASSLMENSDGQKHTWTTAQVRKAMKSLGMDIPDEMTDGDVAYTANMAYADFYPDPLKDEASCLKYAYKVANDPDGYEGMVFMRWTSDAIGKAIKVDWEKFV